MFEFKYAVVANDDVEQVENFKRFLCEQEISCRFNFNNHGRNTAYFLSPDTHDKFIVMERLPEDYNIVSMEDFIRLYLSNISKNTHKQWYNLLKVGDKVRIADREGDPEDYPFSFADEMLDYIDEEYEIIEIHENYCGSYDKNLPFYNGDNRMYLLDEDEGFSWHSSMFVPTTDIFKNLKKLSLIDINSTIIKK